MGVVWKTIKEITCCSTPHPLRAAAAVAGAGNAIALMLAQKSDDYCA